MSVDVQEKSATRTLPTRVASPSSFAHAVLRTSKYEEMIDWYKTLLNAEVVFRNELLCFMTYDFEHHRVAIINVAGLENPTDKHSGLAHLAYSYDDLETLLSTYKRLKAHGIVPNRPINHGPTVSLYYRDPDGTAIELQVDVFKTKEDAHAFMHSEAFKKNPIGVIFDPDELVAKYESGVAISELMRRPDTAGPTSLSS